MALPSNMSRVWVRGTFLDLSGAALSGQITFTLNASVLVNPAAKRIILNRSYTVTLDAGGYFAVQLFATDDPDAVPYGLSYQVVEPTGRRYFITVPQFTPILSSPGDPLDGQRVIELTNVVPTDGIGGGGAQLARGVSVASVTRETVGGVANHIVVHFDDGSSTDLGVFPTPTTGPAGYSPIEFRHDAANHADGNQVDGELWDSGQTAHVAAIGPAGNLPVAQYVAGEWGMVGDTPQAATYHQLQTAKTPTWLGVRGTFHGPATTHSACIAYGVFNLPIYDPAVVSPCHMTFGTRTWELGVFEAGFAFRSIASGTFDTPLAADGVTVYSSEVYLDSREGRIILFLPDRTVREFRDPAFKQQGRWPFFEPFRINTTDEEAFFRYEYGSSTDQSGWARAEALLNASQTATAATPGSLCFRNSTSTHYEPSTLNTATPIDSAVAVSCYVPPSGKVLVRLTAWVESTVPALYLWQINTSVGVSPEVTVITNQTTLSDWRTAPFQFSGLTPGTVVTFYAYHWEFDTSRANPSIKPGVRVWEPFGQRIFLVAEGVK